MSEISEKAIKLIKDLRRDIIIDIMFTPEKNAEDDSLKALVDYIAELEKALNIDADLTVAGLRVELAMATARIAELSQAVGLITTLKPTMVMDVDHPLDMAKEVEAYVTARIAELKAFINQLIEVSEKMFTAVIAAADSYDEGMREWDKIVNDWKEG
jgi:hypothetical protein